MYNKLNKEQKEIVDRLLKDFKLTREEVTIGKDPVIPPKSPCLFIIPNDKEKIIINTQISLDDIK